MGYKIIYSNHSTSRKYKSMTRKGKLALGGLMLVVMAAVISLWGRNIINALIPGNQEITGYAFGQLAENLKSGEPVQDAIVAFCQEIIDNANLQ